MEKLTPHQRLLEAQKEIGAIRKDKKNPFYGSMYADINNILEAVKPVLNKHGFTVWQPPVVIENKQAIRTTVIDIESGESILDSIMLLTDPTKRKTTYTDRDGRQIEEVSEDTQKLGGAITYERRYALQSLLSLEAEDDDGNSTSNPVAQVTRGIDNSKIPETVVGGGNQEETLCSECGKIMAFKYGVKNGKPWKGMFCPTKGHAPIWL